MSIALHRILDAVALNVLPLHVLNLPEADYCLATNRPWHGFGKAELADVLASLLSLGVLRRFGPNASGIGLSAEGGRLWSSCYGVDFHSYAEIGGGLGDSFTTLHCMSRDILASVASEVRRAFPSIEEPLEIRSVDSWSPTYWRRGGRAFAMKLPVLVEVHESELFGVIWKASPRWRSEEPVKLAPFSFVERRL
jgi:hypothetical protein